MLRLIAPCALLLVSLARPAACLAHSSDEERYARPPEEAPSLLSYGFKGFWLGAELGLSVGVLSIGPSWEEGEWRNLVFGAGVGALVGVATAVALVMLDTGTDPPAIGWYILRDAGYGTLLGGLSGAAVGALFVLDSGRPRDILTGAAIGSLVGSAIGVAFGFIEASANERRKKASRQRYERGVRFSIDAVPALPGRHGITLTPGLAGRF